MKKQQFDINEAPPSPAAITVQRHAAERRRLYWKLLTLPVVALLFGLASSVEQFFTPGISLLVVIASLTMCFVWVMLGEVLRMKVVENSPLAKAKCGDMFQYCQATEATRCYYEAVLNQNREFVHGEFLVMERFVTEHRHAMQCKAVYGVPVSV